MNPNTSSLCVTQTQKQFLYLQGIMIILENKNVSHHVFSILFSQKHVILFYLKSKY